MNRDERDLSMQGDSLRADTKSGYTRVMAFVVAALTAWCVWRFPSWLGAQTLDTLNSFVPWLQHILQHGRLSSLESGFAVSYSPPYVYVLSAMSTLEGFVSLSTITKLVNVPFLLAAAALVWWMCRKAGCSTLHAVASAWLVVVAPEIVLNSWSWGQCDMLYAAFLLGFVAAMMLRRPGWAMVSLAVGLSFKLQAIFIGPLVLALLIAGEIPVWTLGLAAAVYLSMMVPAVLAGRPLLDVLYQHQYGTFSQIAMNVANPYELLSSYIPVSANNLVNHIGLVIGAGCNVLLVLYLRTRRAALHTPAGMGVAACLALMMESYVLPKMHDRYYFAANLILLLLLALWPRRFWGKAVLLQAGAVLCYLPFLYNFYPGPRYWLVPFAVVTVAGGLMFRELERIDAEARAAGVLPDGLTTRGAVTS